MVVILIPAYSVNSFTIFQKKMSLTMKWQNFFFQQAPPDISPIFILLQYKIMGLLSEMGCNLRNEGNKKYINQKQQCYHQIV